MRVLRLRDKLGSNYSRRYEEAFNEAEKLSQQKGSKSNSLPRQSDAVDATDSAYAGSRRSEGMHHASAGTAPTTSGELLLKTVPLTVPMQAMNVASRHHHLPFPRQLQFILKALL